MRYRKKPVVIDAVQWWKNGDHPEDGSQTLISDTGVNCGLTEGKVVRWYRHPEIKDTYRQCMHCGVSFFDHGWIDTKEGGHIVCPGDYIITGVQGEHYPCKPDIFAATYEPAEAGHQPAEGQ